MSSDSIPRAAVLLSLLLLSGCPEAPPAASPVVPATDVGTPATETPGTPPASPETDEPVGVAGAAPPEATIKAMLEKDMWGPPVQGGTVHTYNYRSLKIGAPRLGDFLTDGTRANVETYVHPVKVEVEVVRTFTDGTSKQEEKNQSYVFFTDEFGDWTYRFIENN